MKGLTDMSHTAHIEVQLNDEACLEKACERLNLKMVKNETVTFYDGTKHTGIAIKLKNWKYHIIVDGDKVYMDNYNNNWGNIELFNELKMYYGAEKAKKLARKNGYMVKETMVDNKLQVKIFVK